MYVYLNYIPWLELQYLDSLRADCNSSTAELPGDGILAVLLYMYMYLKSHSNDDISDYISGYGVCSSKAGILQLTNDKQ